MALNLGCVSVIWGVGTEISISFESLPELTMRFWDKQPSGSTFTILSIAPWQMLLHCRGWIFRSRFFIYSQLLPLHLVNFPKSFMHHSMFLKDLSVSIYDVTSQLRCGNQQDSLNDSFNLQVYPPLESRVSGSSMVWLFHLYIQSLNQITSFKHFLISI